MLVKLYHKAQQTCGNTQLDWQLQQPLQTARVAAGAMHLHYQVSCKQQLTLHKYSKCLAQERQT